MATIIDSVTHCRLCSVIPDAKIARQHQVIAVEILNSTVPKIRQKIVAVEGLPAKCRRCFNQRHKTQPVAATIQGSFPNHEYNNL